MSDQPNPTPPAVQPPPIPSVLPTAHQTDASPGWVDPRTGILYAGGKVPVALLQERESEAKKHADAALSEKAAREKAEAERDSYKSAAEKAATEAAASTAFALMSSQYPDLADDDVQRVVTEAAVSFAKRNAKDGKAPTVAEVLRSEDFRKSPVVRAYFTPVTGAEPAKPPPRQPPPDPNAGASGRVPGKPPSAEDFAGMTPAQIMANRKAVEDVLAAKGHRVPGSR